MTLQPSNAEPTNLLHDVVERFIVPISGCQRLEVRRRLLRSYRHHVRSAVSTSWWNERTVLSVMSGVSDYSSMWIKEQVLTRLDDGLRRLGRREDGERCEHPVRVLREYITKSARASQVLPPHGSGHRQHGLPRSVARAREHSPPRESWTAASTRVQIRFHLRATA